jgi:signal transduction histidine kinase
MTGASTNRPGRDPAHLGRWLVTFAPACAVLVVEAVDHQVLGDTVSGAVGTAVVCVLALLVSYPVARFAFGALDRARATVAARQREVEALDAMVRERDRLGRELHDGTAQLLTYLLLRTETVGQLVAADRRDDALAELEALRAAADDLYVDVRESISGLRTRVVERGLAVALREYAQDFGERHDIDVTIEVEDVPYAPPLIAFHLFRVAQEALSNVRKHAHARHAWLEVCSKPSQLTLTIADDGRGFHAPEASSEKGTNARSRFGLATMRERALAVGGTFSMDSQPGGGTRIVVTVPLGNVA